MPTDKRKTQHTENTTYNNPVAALDGDGVLHTVFCREYGVRERHGGIGPKLAKLGMDELTAKQTKQ